MHPLAFKLNPLPPISMAKVRKTRASKATELSEDPIESSTQISTQMPPTPPKKKPIGRRKGERPRAVVKRSPVEVEIKKEESTQEPPPYNRYQAFASQQMTDQDERMIDLLSSFDKIFGTDWLKDWTLFNRAGILDCESIDDDGFARLGLIKGVREGSLFEGFVKGRLY
ncbi:hypothetical protein M438DRAFT_215837 [Aureobasidium pullulans EXF-150]|uniref:Uncharacterized protein n=1 Tax=Aureobasidium pullulans EXF-150 TaxID=1043002 RepID=A0A074XGA8_AURPU|nr:uncharacterized protein M438DRAFT_215837 [Aureobasidium pullulans EXF-150]KEQ84550.1 hypothetical protein M438DRAFT_215837 [Aureobasidium pullulans EXF-150]